MSDLYRENILEHSRNPRNYGLLEKPDVSIKDKNPLCGDNITLEINCNNEGIITNVAFTAIGCALSIASASLLSDNIKGRNIKDIENMDYKNMEDLFEGKIGIGRIKCVLLPLTALHKGIKMIQKKDHA